MNSNNKGRINKLYLVAEVEGMNMCRQWVGFSKEEMAGEISQELFGARVKNAFHGMQNEIQKEINK